MSWWADETGAVLGLCIPFWSHTSVHTLRVTVWPSEGLASYSGQVAAALPSLLLIPLHNCMIVTDVGTVGGSFLTSLAQLGSWTGIWLSVTLGP